MSLRELCAEFVWYVIFFLLDEIVVINRRLRLIDFRR